MHLLPRRAARAACRPHRSTAAAKLRARLAAGRVLLLVALALLCPARAARADVAQFLGKTLADVRIELAGAPFTEASVVQLIETRVGEPLSMERVRETIDHLVGLGRFEDIRVFAEPSRARPDAVVLRWALTPVQRIDDIEIGGTPVFDADTLRAAIDDRVGALPATSRIADIVQTLAAYYTERGYRRAEIGSRIVPGRAPELVSLVLTIAPGRRTVIASSTIVGDPHVAAATLVGRLGIERGRPFDRVAIEQRVSAYENELRGLGHYEARVSLDAVSEDDGGASVTVTVERGARIRVVFAGDPLPENRRDTLVPIREERSVDLDLLEDASRNIESYLRSQGYRAAQASYTRESRGDETTLTFTVIRGPLYRLASFEVSGNDALPQARLTPLLQLKPGEPFVDSRVAAVAAAITELHRVEGFARASVKSEVAVGGADTREVTVQLQVDEGPRTVVTDVAIDGAEGVPAARIRQLLSLIPGRPYYRPLLDADRSAIEQLYRDEGFQTVRVDAVTTPADEGRALALRWQIREGAQTIVDHVLVSGNFNTSADLIRREVLLQPGKPLGDNAVMESQRRLAALGLFRRVRIVELPHGASAMRDVLIEVEEAEATSVSYGGGLEAGRRLRTEDGRADDKIEVAPRGFFEITRRNLWGKNRSLSAFMRVSFRPSDPAIDSTDEGGYGFNEYRVWGAYREPRVFDTTGDVQITGFLEQAVRTSFNFSRRGVRAEFGRRLGDAITVNGRYAFDYTRLFDEKIAPEERLLVDRLFPQVRLSTLTGSLLRDSRNDVLDPDRGSVSGVDGTIALRTLGSEVGFFRTFAQAFVYRRVPGAPALTMAAGARLGVSIGFERLVERIDAEGNPVVDASGQPIVDVVADLPASERFFAGGDTTVRGFVLDRLGTEDTLDEQGFPTGGSGLVVMNLELRTPYWKDVGAVGFVDAGNVFLRASDIDIGELRPAAGFGVRYRSPLGPLRADFGFNLNPQVLANGVRERTMVFHISLGQAF
jgi:outer membrane protein assembly complex protein YaeT